MPRPVYLLFYADRATLQMNRSEAVWRDECAAVPGQTRSINLLPTRNENDAFKAYVSSKLHNSRLVETAAVSSLPTPRKISTAWSSADDLEQNGASPTDQNLRE